MRILIDECVPRRLLGVFADYNVATVPYMGWSGKKNGELLKLMIDEGFNIFITVDQNLQYQQNMKGAAIAILVLYAETNSYDDLLALVPRIKETIPIVKPGTVYVIK